MADPKESVVDFIAKFLPEMKDKIVWFSPAFHGSLIDDLMKTQPRSSLPHPHPQWPTQWPDAAVAMAYARGPKPTMIAIDDMEEPMEKTEIQKIEIEATRGGYVVDIGCEDFIYPTAEALCRDLLAYLNAEDKREFEKAFLAAHPKGKAL